MLTGTIKWFDQERGYGFIQLNEIEDVFVHFSSINMKGYKTLSVGDKVLYDLARGKDGYLALNVTPID